MYMQAVYGSAIVYEYIFGAVQVKQFTALFMSALTQPMSDVWILLSDVSRSILRRNSSRQLRPCSSRKRITKLKQTDRQTDEAMAGSAPATRNWNRKLKLESSKGQTQWTKCTYSTHKLEKTLDPRDRKSILHHHTMRTAQQFA